MLILKKNCVRKGTVSFWIGGVRINESCTGLWLYSVYRMSRSLPKNGGILHWDIYVKAVDTAIGNKVTWS